MSPPPSPPARHHPDHGGKPRAICAPSYALLYGATRIAKLSQYRVSRITALHRLICSDDDRVSNGQVRMRARPRYCVCWNVAAQAGFCAVAEAGAANSKARGPFPPKARLAFPPARSACLLPTQAASGGDTTVRTRSTPAVHRMGLVTSVLLPGFYSTVPVSTQDMAECGRCATALGSAHRRTAVAEVISPELCTVTLRILKSASAAGLWI